MTSAASITTTVQPFTAQNVQSWEVWHPRVGRERSQVVTLIQESTHLLHDLAVRVQSYLYFPTCVLSLSEHVYSEGPIPFSVQELHPVNFNDLTLPSGGFNGSRIASEIQGRYDFSTEGEEDLVVTAFERQGLTVSTYLTLPVKERQERVREQYGVQLTNADQITDAVTVRVIVPQPPSSARMCLNLVFSPEHQERGVLLHFQTAEPDDFHHPGLLRSGKPESSLSRTSRRLCLYGERAGRNDFDRAPNAIFGLSQAGILSVVALTRRNQVFHIVPFSPSASSSECYNNGGKTRLFSSEAATADAMRIEICPGSTSPSPSLSPPPAAPVKGEKKGSGRRTYTQEGELLMIKSQ